MYNAIDQVQRQYTYAIQPVKFFEPENNKAAQKNSFNFFNQFENKSLNNPFHPDVSNSDKGRRLDLLG